MNKEKNVKLSVFVSLILRHKPEVINCSVDSEGYLEVDKLIEGINKEGHYFINKEILDEIVNTDSKKRYSYNEDKTKIRANQGHSLKHVKINFKEVKPPVKLYHGTNEKFIDYIIKEGLVKKSRTHVHLSDSILTAAIVANRRKNSEPVLLKIDSDRMYKDGIKFYLSDNDVYLVDYVDPKYIHIME